MQLRFDPILTIVPTLLAIFGSATFYLIGKDGILIAEKQIVLLIIGIIVYAIFSLIDYRIFKNNSSFAIFLYGVSCILLLLTFLSPEIRGAQSWITIAWIRFQPAEIVKLGLLILLAKYFSQKHVEIYRIQHILASGFYMIIPAFLVMAQSDLGSATVIITLWVSVLVFSGINKKHLLAILILGITISSIGWFAVLQPYQKDRLVAFLNPYSDPSGTGYNTIQARTTLGSGQMLGTYFTKKEDKVSVLVPEPYNDFAFAAFGQKFGLMGILILISLITLLMWRIGNITSKTDNNFGRLYGLGLMSIIFVHFVINAGMNLGLLPITGIPFPFLSNGGSHLITLMAGLGIINNISINSRTSAGNAHSFHQMT